MAERKKGIQVQRFNLTCQDLTERFSFFRIPGLRLQEAPSELMWVIVFFFSGMGGEEKEEEDGGPWITEMILPFILALNRAPSSLPKPR